jgi:hypothetical protein
MKENLRTYVKDAITKLSNIKVWLKDRWLFLLTIIMFLILITTPLVEKIAFIPDNFNLSKVNPKDFFGLIIGVIASFFGILMAVIILTVEVFKEKISKNRHTNPLENILIRDSIFHSVNLMGLSFISYVFFETFNSAKSLTIGYFLGIIFIVYIYSVFFVIKKIVSKSSHIKANIERVNELDLNSFKSASRYYLHKPEEANEILKALKKEIDSYILSNNVSAYEKINNDILTKALDLISDGQDRTNCDYIIGGLVWLWRENCKTAIRVDDSNYFELVWNNIKDIYIYFANKKAQLLHIQDLYLFIIFDFLKLHIQLNNSMPLSTAIDCVEVSFKANLYYNCPKEEDLKRLVKMYEGGKYEQTHFRDSSQWDSIHDIIQCLGSIQETALKIGDKDAFKESIRRVETICYELNFDFPNLGKYQKGNLTWRSLSTSFSNSYSALKSGMYESTLDCLYIPESLITRLIEKNNTDIKDIRIILRTLADNIILAFKKRKLFMNKDYGTLNDFCMIGILLMKHYKTNKTAKQTVNYIIKVLTRLKKLAEEDLTALSPNDYLAIKSKIKHFTDVAVRNDDFNEDEKPVKKWKKILSDFTDVNEEVDFGIVKWKVKKNTK